MYSEFYYYVPKKLVDELWFNLGCLLLNSWYWYTTQHWVIECKTCWHFVEGFFFLFFLPFYVTWYVWWFNFYRIAKSRKSGSCSVFCTSSLFSLFCCLLNLCKQFQSCYLMQYSLMSVTILPSVSGPTVIRSMPPERR